MLKCLPDLGVGLEGAGLHQSVDLGVVAVLTGERVVRKVRAS
tara:strand:+ start:77 stop:202 length:126 start_codon:yes stop_codon:yes gene_type:complete